MKERRRFVRFPLSVSLSYIYLSSTTDQIWVRTHDISVKGMGVMTAEEILPGAYLDLCLSMPDNGQLIQAKGKVVWNNFIEPYKYRLGILLEEAELKPVPLVLRAISIMNK